jgi:hypothetical protein
MGDDSNEEVIDDFQPRADPAGLRQSKSAVPRLTNPVGENPKFLNRLDGIVGAKLDPKIVWAFHPRVHRETQNDL